MYIENPVVSTKKVLNQISESGKRVGCKVNSQKSMAFLYNNSKISEREKFPFTIATKKNKVPRNKFNQGGKDL